MQSTLSTKVELNLPDTLPTDHREPVSKAELPVVFAATGSRPHTDGPLGVYAEERLDPVLHR